MSVHFILGGARSGKSGHAERQARWHMSQVTDGQLHYVATAIAFDDEMRERIAHHRRQRGDGWLEHEVPCQLAQTLARMTSQDVVLVDCLTLWLNNVIYNDGQPLNAEQVSQRIKELAATLQQTPATILLVSNEVGMGVVPLGEVSRLFVDHAGWMNQAVAKVADSVVLVTAGIPLALKGRV